MFKNSNDSCCCCCDACINIKPIYKRVWIPKWVCYKPSIMECCNQCCNSNYDSNYGSNYGSNYDSNYGSNYGSNYDSNYCNGNNGYYNNQEVQ